MNQENLQSGALTAQLQTTLLTTPRASPDLWSRIEQMHARRRTQRRLSLTATTVVVAFCLIGYAGLHAPSPAVTRVEAIDWQARAQALELQLLTLDRARGVASAVGTSEVESELNRIDAQLQTAYEHSAYTNELLPLWKRRSELLDTLLLARKQGLALTSI